MNVKQEITDHAAAEDKKVLLWLFKRYHWESQWHFVARCTFQQ